MPVNVPVPVPGARNVGRWAADRATFTRASLSIVLNLAEGAGKHSKPDKRRCYLTARGSATESAALLDVCVRLGLLDGAGHKTGKEMVVRIVSPVGDFQGSSMLVKLSQSCEA